MKKQQTFLIEIDDDQLRSLCERLPLEETDRKIAYALATLCARVGAYTPARGVGQREIAKIAGLGVRTVKRRLPYLIRYGILSVDRSNGRSNCYQFDLHMLLDAPASTHDLYGYIKQRPTASAEKSEPKINERQRLLFVDADEVEPTVPAAEEKCSLLSRMSGAVVQFTKRMFTNKTSATPHEPGPSSQKPVPNRGHVDPNRCQTGATLENASAEPGPSEIIGAETGAKPGPTGVQSSGEPGPNQCQTGANAPTVHKHNTYHSNRKNLKKHININSTSTFHREEDVDVELDFFETEETPPLDWSLPPSTTRKNSELPPGERKIIWGRDVREDDLQNPPALQELYEVAVEQGFFLVSEAARRNFFALAHYVCRQKKVRSKVGLFSSLVDRTSKSKINCEWEKNLSFDDDKWATGAINDYDHPPYERS
tara:strand:- start:262 stop:1539 length:1278 start_codon:yes stop_codon:yes gene_type:complete